MADLSVTIILPHGSARTAEIPDDIQVHDLIMELTSLLKLPTIGPDGRPMGYRIDSKALGRELGEAETLAEAGVPQDDRLMLTADITAGAVSIDQSPRMRRLKADYNRMVDLVAQSDFIQFEAKSLRPGLPPERYIIIFKCRGVISVNKNGEPQLGTTHKVELYLHNHYPQRWPGMKWLTPIWHPNINHHNGSVCVDAAWWTASRSLDRLVVMLGEMVQYKNFHDDPTQPPFPWDPEAARWSRKYRKSHPNAFPVDNRELLRPQKVKIKPKQSEKKQRIRLK